MNSNANLFRRYARVEEQMMRASMPRTSELDAPKKMDRYELMALRIARRHTAAINRALDKQMSTLTYKIGEVAQS
jgi:hypothetical protein